MKKEELVALGVPEEIAAKLEAAIAEGMKGFVPRARLDEVIGEKKAAEAAVKERDAQLESLKKTAGSAEELQKKIDGMLEDNKARDAAHAEEIHRLKLDNAVSAALTEARALNQKAARALLDLKNAAFDENGRIVGLDAQIEALKSAEDSKFLFGSGAPALKGAKLGEDGLDGPEGRVDFAKMSYEQLAAYLEANPDTKLD